jgi:hypothetical protein
MKQSWKPVSLCVVVISVAIGALLTGCGGGGSSKIRFLSLSPDAPPFNILVDTKTVTNNFGFAVSTGYMSISSGSRQIQYEPVGTTNPVINTTEDIAGGTNNTFIAENFLATIKGVSYVDNQTVPTTGNFQVRVINAAASLGAADIYLLPSGTDINSVTPTASNVPVGGATAYISLAAGAYQIFFTQPNFKTVQIDSGTITFAANTNRTIIGYSGQFGGFATLTLNDLN